MATEQQDLKKLLYDTLFGNEGSMTMKEFTSAFGVIVKHVLAFEQKVKDGNKLAGEELEYMFELLRKQLKQDAKTDLTGAKAEGLARIDVAIAAMNKRVAALKDGETPSATALVRLIKPLIPAPKDGKTPTEAQLKRIMKPMIPDPISGSPDTGTDIVKKINEKDTGILIKKERVEGWEEMDSRVRTAEANSRMGQAGGSYVYEHDLSDQLDGVTKTFTLPSNARVIAVLSSSAPGIFRKTVDYTTTASAITFTSAIDADATLATGQSLVLIYKIL